MDTKDLELMLKLEQLVEAADEEVLAFSKRFAHNQTSYDRYRTQCFALIDKYFWDIVGQMEWKPPTSTYQDITYEKKMLGYLDSCHAHREGGWLNNALKEIGLDG